MQPRVILTLKVLILVLIALLIVIQVAMIPGVAASTAARNPGLAHLMIPGIVGGVLLLVLVEVALLCVFRLLSLVRADRIFSTDAFRYVDIIIGALLAFAVLIVVAGVVLSASRAFNPSVLVLAVFGVTVCIGLALLVVVLRGLLHKALQLEQDMSEVV